MKNVKFSRRSFLKAGAAASVASLVAANAAVASAAEPKAAAQENGLFDGMFGGKTPKYIFLFIGDGMGVAQIQSASFYKGTVENNGAVTPAELSFMKFPFVGSVTTYDSTSFCPDSASTATSIASGEKTESGVINMTPWTRDVPFAPSTSTTPPPPPSTPIRPAARTTTRSARSWPTAALSTLPAATSRTPAAAPSPTTTWPSPRATSWSPPRPAPLP